MLIVVFTFLHLFLGLSRNSLYRSKVETAKSFQLFINESKILFRSIITLALGFVRLRHAVSIGWACAPQAVVGWGGLAFQGKPVSNSRVVFSHAQRVHVSLM